MPIVSVDQTGDEIYVPAGETVLAGLNAAGLAYTAGCRRGGCGVCKAVLLEGRISHNRAVAAEVLSSDERAEGFCLTCRAVPESDIRLGFSEGSLRLVLPALRAINEKARLRAAASASQPKE